MENNSVKSFYNQTVLNEWNRLNTNWVEFEITYAHIISLLDKNGLILDIGGGPGRYAFRLTADGHSVYLADLADDNITFALNKSKELNVKLAGCRTVNILDMNCFQDNLFDSIICLGPFYHLLNQDEKMKAIKELHRVVKPGGYFFCAFITNYAFMFDCLKWDISSIEKNENRIKEYYKNGLHKQINQSKGFPDASFVDPLTINSLFSEYFTPIKLFGCESIINMRQSEILNLSENQQKKWLDLAIEFSVENCGIASSEHVVYVGKKIN